MKTVNYLSPYHQPQKVTPSKVICIGRNYAKHIAELNNKNTGDMVVFIKPNSAIDELLYTHQIGCRYAIHYEAELCFMVEAGQFSAIGFGLDLTKRELQSELKTKGLPWERAKAFDRSAVLGDFIPLTDEYSVADLSVELLINQQVRQKGTVKEMLFSPAVILQDVKRFMSLEDGDIVMTGTPEGVGPVKQGDEFVGRIYHHNEVLLEASWVAQ
ncbi:fumarylacetoacetate hydrolase family protein [Eionea flava]